MEAKKVEAIKLQREQHPIIPLAEATEDDKEEEAFADDEMDDESESSDSSDDEGEDHDELTGEKMAGEEESENADEEEAGVTDWLRCFIGAS